MLVKKKPMKKYKYTPPTHSKSSTTISSSYKYAGNGTATSSPSVNVVRPGAPKSSYPAPSRPTAPPPSKPLYRPPPVNTSYRPPPVKPAPVAPRKPLPPTAHKPQGERGVVYMHKICTMSCSAPAVYIERCCGNNIM